MNYIGRRLLGLLFLSISMFLFYKLTIPFYQNAVSSKNWPVIEGKVLKSRVNPNAGDDKDLYQLQFDYEYSVNGILHHGKGRYFDLGEPSQSWKDNLYDFARTHPVGSAIEVHYNPKAPENSTILTGITFLGGFLIGLNVFFLFFSTYLVLFPEEWRSRSEY